MSPHERADPAQGIRSLLAIWRGLIEMGCSPAEIRHGLSYPDGEFERWLMDERDSESHAIDRWGRGG